jgi:hypothetical protein
MFLYNATHLWQKRRLQAAAPLPHSILLAASLPLHDVPGCKHPDGYTGLFPQSS